MVAAARWRPTSNLIRAFGRPAETLPTPVVGGRFVGAGRGRRGDSTALVRLCPDLYLTLVYAGCKSGLRRPGGTTNH